MTRRKLLTFVSWKGDGYSGIETGVNEYMTKVFGALDHPCDPGFLLGRTSAVTSTPLITKITM